MKLLLVMCLALAVGAIANGREESKPARENASGKGHVSKAKPKKLSEKKPAKEAPAREQLHSPIDVLEAHKDAYVGKRPEVFLVDPQGLLGVGEREERTAFLNYHAGDSAIDLYVYLCQADQEIPKDWHGEGWVDKVFGGGRPAAAIFYHLGKPQASTMLVTRQIAEKVSVLERGRAMENAVMQALKKSDKTGQLQTFLIQMSIRIYWMERIMNGDKAETSAAPLNDKAASKKSAAKGIEKFRPLIDMVAPHVMPGGLAIGTIVLLGVMRVVLRHRARYRFPEFEVEPRLGGPHAAGVGAVLSFGRAAPSPAYQREQMPEYLRRA
jgi:hypothetical protein